ncbi:hypothetical protein N658DRAFT_498199 [Parathielavia hyrcaniae]|uniref:Uncharacterized protein n=1 Tax=Parathielavia hyrcaniae TaxID=113614 RepID=A0AAN6T002_9PEZI|nr:hypothetical protein N658DRAFT_498199 [Parathielavia hyrcaniae]
MAARGRDDARQESRTYPLDIPLPFRRYDHHRLGVRDLLVHRLVAEFMRPSTVHPAIFDEYLRPVMNNIEGNTVFTTPRAWQCNYSHWNGSSEGLWRLLGDLELLEEMLCTDASTSYYVSNRSPVMPKVPSRGPWREQRVNHQEPALLVVPFVLGEWLTDLVMRHYLEIDDMMFRIWISRATVPRPVQGPKPSATARKNGLESAETLRRQTQERSHRYWLTDHLPVLERWSRKMANTTQLSVYDGGASLPAVRQEADLHVWGAQGASQRLHARATHWAVGQMRSTKQYIPRLPKWPWAKKPTSVEGSELPLVAQRSVGGQVTRSRLDVNIRAGTSRDQHKFRDASADTGDARGRDAARDAGNRGRQRTRGSSEPPAGTYAMFRGVCDQ